MYDKCYFCLDQLPKLKKRIHSKLFRKFWRSRGTKEPAYITVNNFYFVLSMWQIYFSKQLAKLGRVNPLELLAELVLGYTLAHKS